MRTTRNKPNKGKGGCMLSAVSPYTCDKKAVVTRITTAGKLVHLCKKCDQNFGSVVGEGVYHIE